MVKEGPCCHCGVTSTPLWRNGPEHKPVLCNACGSRWRTKGTLENYVPLHVRDLTDQVEPKVSKEKIMPLMNNLQRVQKRKLENVIPETEKTVPLHGQNFQKVLEEDNGNRSSSGSAMSCSESRVHAGAPDIIDLRAFIHSSTSAQSCGWDVPSRKRSCIHRTMPSPLARLKKDLYSIYSEQGSSSTSTASDGDLLYGTETQTGSIEIAHGGVLIRPKVVEEESEASSFPADNNQSYIANEATSQSASYSVSTRCIGIGKSKERVEEHEKRDETLCEMLDTKQDRTSPLISIDRNDVINFETFTSLSIEERQQLMKLLSPADTVNPPMSLKSMFCSSQFQENIRSFQHLLRMEVIDLSFSDVDLEERKSFKNSVLCDLRKAKWVEQYEQQKDLKHKQNTQRGRSSVLKHSGSTPFKRQNNNPVPKDGIGIPVRKCRPSGLSICSKTPTNSSDAVSRLTHTGDTFTGNKAAACFSPSSRVASTRDGNSMLSSLQLTDQDIHPSVAANTSTSIPEAEILDNLYMGKTDKKNTSFERHGSNSPQPKRRGPNNITTSAAALFECSNVCL